jgi:hypothetical protein
MFHYRKSLINRNSSVPIRIIDILLYLYFKVNGKCVCAGNWLLRKVSSKDALKPGTKSSELGNKKLEVFKDEN